MQLFSKIFNRLGSKCYHFYSQQEIVGSSSSHSLDVLVPPSEEPTFNTIEETPDTVLFYEEDDDFSDTEADNSEVIDNEAAKDPDLNDVN